MNKMTMNDMLMTDCYLKELEKEYKIEWKFFKNSDNDYDLIYVTVNIGKYKYYISKSDFLKKDYDHWIWMETEIFNIQRIITLIEFVNNTFTGRLGD